MTRESDNEGFVRLVQDEIGVEPDGWAGPKTHGAWGEYLYRVHDTMPFGPRRPVLSTAYRLPDDQYRHERHAKTLIVLHHTSGGPAETTFNWWRTTQARIGVAYIVDRTGRIFEVFPPEAWGYHLGIKGDGNRTDRRSIGIEIASEGGLTPGPQGGLYAFGTVAPRTEYRGTVYRPPGGSWRGYWAFAAYTEPAIASVCKLVDWLCGRFEIERVSPGPAEHVPREVVGVCSHAQLRPDKSDVHPGFPWERLETVARLERA